MAESTKPSAGQPTCAVVITTRNRRDLLRLALASCYRQSAKPEVIVVIDKSDDDSEAMVRAEFPQTKMIVMTERGGSAATRNRGVAITEAEIILFLDDDAEFSSVRVIEQTLGDFDHPRVASVAVPLINDYGTHKVLKHPRCRRGDPPITTMHPLAAALAVKRDIFQSLGGFAGFLLYAGEEEELVTRMFRRGYLVRFGTSDYVLHTPSPIRDHSFHDHLGRRNGLIRYFLITPWFVLLPYLVANTLHGIRHAFRIRRFRANLSGLLAGWRELPGMVRHRRPMSWREFRLYRRLSGRNVPIESVEHELPALQ